MTLLCWLTFLDDQMGELCITLPLAQVSRLRLEPLHLHRPKSPPFHILHRHCQIIPRAISEFLRAKKVMVNGFLIPFGMLYVGTNLLSVNGRGVEPALINPTKQVDQLAADCCKRHIDYWSSYDSISPEVRASYLQRLLTGKCDPDSDLGYVFLYFYGLERRALWVAAGNPQARAELPLIEREVCRLLDIYGNSRSFRCYASSLRDYLAATRETGVTPEYLSVPPVCERVSLKLRVELGQLFRAGQSLSSEWAAAWYLAVPDLPRFVLR